MANQGLPANPLPPRGTEHTFPRPRRAPAATQRRSSQQARMRQALKVAKARYTRSPTPENAYVVVTLSNRVRQARREMKGDR
jgi:hypothetical protein